MLLLKGRLVGGHKVHRVHGRTSILYTGGIADGIELILAFGDIFCLGECYIIVNGCTVQQHVGNNPH